MKIFEAFLYLLGMPLVSPLFKNQRDEKPSLKDRLQHYLRFCFQNSLSFKAFWKHFSASYFVTIPQSQA